MKYVDLIQYFQILDKDVPKEYGLEQLNKMIMNHITIFKFSNYERFLQNKPTEYNFNTIISNINKFKGGLCLNLNNAFSKYLHIHGYTNKLIKCYKINKQGIYDPIYHVGLMVYFNRAKYFVDVAYGRYYTEAIKLEDGKFNEFVIKKDNNSYKIFKDNTEILLVTNQKLHVEDIGEHYIKCLNLPNNYMGLTSYLWESIYNPEKKDYIVSKL